LKICKYILFNEFYKNKFFNEKNSLGINALLLANYKKTFLGSKKKHTKWTFKIVNSCYFNPPYHALTLVGNHSHKCHLLHTKKILQKVTSPSGLIFFKCIDLFSKSQHNPTPYVRDMNVPTNNPKLINLSFMSPHILM
jgi:hypothetical protein